MRFRTGALLLSLATVGAAAGKLPRDANNAIPKYPYDLNTTKSCTWWLDSDGSLSCSDVERIYGVALVDFFIWNPSLIGGNCDKLSNQTSFCLAVATTPKARPSTKTSTVVPTAVTTTVSLPLPSNGVNTPVPFQDGMTESCSAFYLTKKGDTCGGIATSHGISLQDFISWNPGVGGASCPTLWADAYVCVNVLGRPPTRTKVGNGVNTPAPIQSGMTEQCKSFYLVQKGDTCEDIAARYRITVTQLLDWNPGAKPDCSGLWSDSYCCVGTL
ncbi:hypothetical protein GQ53DRAFT_720373 [Thozetella sp. PMI_491]|nr:hypothetical protein GQ53DRAFT_720373 [Thozetella sp. PMI_491]